MRDDRFLDDVQTDATPRRNQEFDPTRADLSPEDYFVMTRVDGKTSLKQLVLISGFPESRAREILGKLRSRRAILFPGDPAGPPPAPEPPPPPPPPAVRADDPRMQEAIDLSDEQKRSILAKHRAIAQATLFEILEVPQGAGKREIKVAYRKISKDFHPDRFFGKKLGSFKDMLAEIFEVASVALATLSDDAQRAAYVETLRSAQAQAQAQAQAGTAARPESGAARSPMPILATPPLGVAILTPNQRAAAEIYEEACLHHVSGQLDTALAEFDAAIALDPQPRYLRRAAEAALKAQRLRDAEEYAKKATEIDIHNAASHRILGRVLASSGKPHEARAAYVQALRIDPGNPHIAAELSQLDERGQ